MTGGGLMQRPFAVIGFTYISALIAASYAGLGISAAAAALCAVFALTVFFGMNFFKHRKAVATVFFTAAAAFGAFCITEAFFYNPVMTLDGQSAEITGAITDAPAESYGRYLYTIKADKIVVDGKTSSIKTKIRIASYYKLDAEPFDIITADAKLSAPKQVNSYGYNSRLYYKSKGIYLFANTDDIKITKVSKRPLYYYAIKLREYISGVMDKYVGGTPGALASGILIGDTSQLPESVSNDFSTTGISHLLAVSGTQTSLIMQYLMLLLCGLRIPRRPAAAATAGAVVCFMAVTGFSASVMRAGIMSIICLAAILVRRDADTLNSLGLSALLMCLANPFAATDVGLLLSVSATLGMITISPRLIAFCHAKLPQKHFGKPLKAVLGVLCETIGASVLTYPVIVFSFGRVSLISLAANILEVPVSLFVTLAAALIAVFSPAVFLVFLIKPIAILVRIGCAFMIWYAHALASLPFASVSSSYGFVDIIVIFSVVLLILYFVFKNKGANAGVCVSCALFALAVGIFSYSVASRGVMTVAVLSDSGGAVVTSRGHAVVIDLPPDDKYPETAVEQYLKAHNINTIDAVIMTSYDKKRAQSLSTLESDMRVLHAYMPEKSTCKTDLGSKEPKKISTATKINAPYGVTITMLPDSANDGMIALVNFLSSKAVVTGGGTLGDYSKYNSSALKSDLLVFGNGTDSNFAKLVSPKDAVGGAGSSAQTLTALLTNGANINTGSCLYMTRGNGYKFAR
jgi:competence protein ComEC